MISLSYIGKKNKEQILQNHTNYSFSKKWNTENNLLISGDNYSAMQMLLRDYDLKGKIDLIYIDPPFATKNVFTAGEDRVSTISSKQSDTVAYSDVLVGEAFLEFLRERLLMAYELLSEKGSIYVHIDYKIGHYVKVLMDEIFGIENFKNDITRIKCNPKNFSRKAYGNIKDLILFYGKSKNTIWNDPREIFTEEDIKKLYKKIDEHGRFYNNTFACTR